MYLILIAIICIVIALFLVKKSIFKPKTAQALRMIQQEGTVLLDVRTPSEYETGHLTGSINIPVQELRQSIGKLPDKNASIVAYCRSGARSGMAVSMLQQEGYTNAINGGAYEDLKKAMS